MAVGLHRAAAVSALLPERNSLGNTAASVPGRGVASLVGGRGEGRGASLTLRRAAPRRRAFWGTSAKLWAPGCPRPPICRGNFIWSELTVIKWPILSTSEWRIKKPVLNCTPLILCLTQCIFWLCCLISLLSQCRKKGVLFRPLQLQ